LNNSQRRCSLLALAAVALLVSGCAGFQVGPGTATGAGIGAAIGGVSARDTVAGVVGGAIIGGAIGSLGDAADGRPGISIYEERNYGGRRYYDDRDNRYYRYYRYYRGRPHYRHPPVYVEPPHRHHGPVIVYPPHRPQWDPRCNCRH